MIAVLGDRETVTGFRIAGVKDCFETDESNIRDKLEFVKDKKVVIINEKLYRIVEKEGLVLKNIFVPVPDKYGYLGTDLIGNLVREIIGSQFEF